MTKRKFYKTKITFEVLSEDPIPADLEMQEIVRECIDGEYSGATVGNKETILNGKQAAKALLKQHSGTAFFRLTADGNDIM